MAVQNPQGQAHRWLRALWSAGLWAGLLACAAPSSPLAPNSPAAFTPEQRCVADGGTWDKDNLRIPQGHCAKGTAARCEAAGGRWQRVCMLGTLACVQPYADAGKACSDGRECAGRRCLLPRGASPQAAPLKGQCIANNNPCHFGINIENGQLVPTAVAD